MSQIKKRKKFNSPNVVYIVLGLLLLFYSLFIVAMMLWGVNTSLKSDDDYVRGILVGKVRKGNVLGLPTLTEGLFNSREEFFHLKNYKTVIENLRYKSSVGSGYYRGSKYVSLQAHTRFGALLGKTGEELNFVYLPDMLLNTLIYVCGCAVAATVVPALTAFLTAKYDFKLSGIIFILYTMMMCMPIVGNQPAQLAFFKATGLYDTMFGIILQWASGAGMYYFVFYAYFKGMPETYREAASIDGASELTVMIKIYFPLAIKMMATVFLIQFVSLWNDYQYPLLFLPTKPTLATAVYIITGSRSDAAPAELQYTPAKIAASMLLALPILVLFIAFKNKLMGDITLGGIKE